MGRQFRSGHARGQTCLQFVNEGILHKVSCIDLYLIKLSYKSNSCVLYLSKLSYKSSWRDLYLISCVSGI